MRLLRHLLHYTLTLALAFGILALLLWPAPQLSESVHQLNDKVAHGAIFAVLGVVFWGEYIYRHPQSSYSRAVLLLTPFLVIFAGGSEILQDRLPQFNRSGDWHDFVADCVGIAFATTLGLMWLAWRKRTTTP